jgi:quinoprotein glucose dehydrogenase
MIAKYYRLTVFLGIQALLFAACKNDEAPDQYNSWNIAGGNATGNKYSSLTQIDTNTVSQLEIAWEYHTGDADTAAHSQIQCNPIIVNGVLYATSPQLKLLALDAATGKAKWVFSPFDSIAGNK